LSVSLSTNILKSPKKRALAAAERDAQICKLRALGQPLEAIADRLGISERTVRRVVTRRLEDLKTAARYDTEQIRANHLLELEMLRNRLAGLLASNTPGDRLGAARTWLNLQQREATLLGLDAPARIELAAQQEAATALLAHLEALLEPELMERVIDAVSQL